MRATTAGRRPLAICSRDLAPRLEQLVAPRVIERLGDLVLAADVLHGAVAPQPGKHDLELLLGGELPVPALISQLGLLRSSGHARSRLGRDRRPSGSSPVRANS